jgi:hypothetical protein
VHVALVTDDADEEDERFGVSLSGESNAGVARRSAVGTIVDDDDRPGISVDDVRVAEDTGSEVNAAFTVSLSKASRRTTTVDFATADGSATAGSDYSEVRTTLAFAPGETSKQVNVPVSGDSADEPDETFAALLTAPGNGVVDDGEGVATIVDNDDPPPAPPAPPVQQPQQPQDQRDTNEPGLTFDALVRRLSRASLVSNGLSFELSSDEPVSLDVQLIARPRMLTTARSGDVVIARKKWPMGSGKRTVKLRVLRKLRRRLTHHRAELRLVVLATDAAGNRSRATKKVVLRP